MPTALKVFVRILTRYDKKEEHKAALRKSYRRMKKNPRMTSNQISDAYFRDGMSDLNRNGIARGGFITQYFKKRKL